MNCALCGKPIDPLSRNSLQKVEGWQQKAGIRWTGTHGGSDIRARKGLQEWAHELCVERVRNGINPNQDSLL